MYRHYLTAAVHAAPWLLSVSMILIHQALPGRLWPPVVTFEKAPDIPIAFKMAGRTLRAFAGSWMQESSNQNVARDNAI